MSEPSESYSAKFKEQAEPPKTLLSIFKRQAEEQGIPFLHKFLFRAKPQAFYFFIFHLFASSSSFIYLYFSFDCIEF